MIFWIAFTSCRLVLWDRFLVVEDCNRQKVLGLRKAWLVFNYVMDNTTISLKCSNRASWEAKQKNAIVFCVSTEVIQQNIFTLRGNG